MGELCPRRCTSPIMRPEIYPAKRLERFLKRHKIATLPDLKEVLGTQVDSTLFRKLKELSYCSSYSHRGGYYTLNEIARFDELGLWSFRSVWFSTHGTLISTVEALVDGSEAGYYAKELENIVHVEVKVPLLNLVGERRIHRKEVSGLYLYLSRDRARSEEQLGARRLHDAEPPDLGVGPGLRVLPDELKAAIILFFSLLDERQRRLYAGLESMKLGHGGDRKIADLLGMNVHTVAKGRQDLIHQDFEVDRVRRAGAGRPSVEKKRRKSSKGSKKP